MNNAVILRTSDEGITWVPQSAPQLTPTLVYVTCPTTVFCLAEEDVSYPLTIDEVHVIATTDGGADWTAIGGFDVLGQTSGLHCVSQQLCYLISSLGGVVKSTDGGATWTPLTWANSSSPQLWNFTRGISCAGASACFLAGVTFRSAPNATPAFGFAKIAGDTVIQVHSTPKVGGFEAQGISCAASSSCSVVGVGTHGASDLSTSDGGASWRVRSLPVSIEGIGGLSCPNAGHCVALVESRIHSGLLVASTLTSGVTWDVRRISPASNPPFDHGISCPAMASCFVESDTSPSGSVFVVSGGGTSWSAHPVQVGAFNPLALVTCPTASVCVTVGSPVPLRTTDGGATWAPVLATPQFFTLYSALACPTTSLCLSGGQVRGIAALLRSTDAGATWHQVPIPAGNQSLSSLACATATTCVATSADWGGYTGPGYDYAHFFRTTDGGRSWRRYRVLEPFNSVACGSSSTCVAVAQSGGVYASTNAGRSWNPVGDLTIHPQSVGCVSATVCFTTGNSTSSDVLYGTTDGGRNWSQLASGSDHGLGCRGTVCWYLAGSLLETTVDGGMHWSAISTPTQASAIAATASATGAWILVGADAQNGAFVATTS